MKFLNFTVTRRTGDVVPGAPIYIYLQGTTTLAPGVVNKDGVLKNPLVADVNGQADVGAPDGTYDVHFVVGGGEPPHIKRAVQYYDLAGAVDIAVSTTTEKAAQATAAAFSASLQADRSELEADRAESAATSAAISSGIFATPDEGVDPLTGVPVGDYFNVRSPLSDHYVDEYLNEGGVPEPTGKSYPSAEAVADVRQLALSAASAFTSNSLILTDGVANDCGRAVIAVSLAAEYTAHRIVAHTIGKNWHSETFGYLLNLQFYDLSTGRKLTAVLDPAMVISDRPYFASPTPQESLGVVRYEIRVNNFPASPTLGSVVGECTIDWTRIADGNRRVDIENGVLVAAAYSDIAAIGLYDGTSIGNARSVSPLRANASFYDWPSYSRNPFPVLEFWGVPDGETIRLNTIWNYYYNSLSTKYFASVGFASSAGYHIAPSLSPQSDIAQYSQWEIEAQLTGRIEYPLYVGGNSLTEPVGRVVVDWDAVRHPTSVRFIGVDGGSVVERFMTDRAPAGTYSGWWSGKKVSALGDSITYGFIPRNAPGYPGQLSSWLPLVATALGMSYQNKGISGSTVAVPPGGGRNPFVGRYDDLDNDADLIIVMGGTNDFRNSVPLGTMYSRSDSTFYGALHLLCDGLIKKYRIDQGTTVGRDKMIMLMTPIKIIDAAGELDHAIDPYVAAVQEVGAYYAMPVLDLHNLSGLTPHVQQTIVGTEPGFTGYYNPYMTDGVHPTQEGHVAMARVIAGFVRGLGGAV